MMKQLLLRLVLWFITRVFYRMTVICADHVPDHGGGLLIINHVSFVDVLLESATPSNPKSALEIEILSSGRGLPRYAILAGIPPWL